MIRGCGVIVMNDKGEILIGKRSDGQGWCGGGGHIEAGESPLKAARRELKEEFGILGYPLRYLGRIEGDGDKGNEYTSDIFLCRSYIGEPKCDRDEMLTSRWVPKEEIGNYRLFEPFEKSLKLLKTALTEEEKHGTMDKETLDFTKENFREDLVTRGEGGKFAKAGSSGAKSEKSGERNFSARRMPNGLRKSALHILTDIEISDLEKCRRELEIPDGILQYNQGETTGFLDIDRKINVRGDVFPDENGIGARDRMSEKAVLAHEYYGHYIFYPSEYPEGDWRDEFRASREAALHAPGLSDEERRDLMTDAYDRAKEAGADIKPDETARRIMYGF